MNSQELEFIIKMRDEASALIENLGGSFGKAGKGAKGLSDDNRKVAGSLDEITTSAKQAIAALAGVATSAGLIRKSVGAWNAYEMGIVGVVKTTNLAGRELEDFRRKFDSLDKTMKGISTRELAGLSETVGQMGVKGVDDIVAMTEVLGKLGVTSDVVGQQGATMVGRILSLTGEGPAGVRQFGDALNQLGNNSKATESEILNMAAAVAQSTSEFGLSSKQVLALSAAARELDLKFEVTGSTFGRVLRNLRDGSATGAKSFKTFLEQASLTREQFDQMMKDDPSEVLINFAEVYAKMTKTGQAVTFLEQLGLNTDEIKRVFGTIGVRVEEVRATMNQLSGDDWVGALDREFAAFSAAQENRMIALGKAMTSAFAAVGEALAPLTGPLVDGLTSGIYAAITAFKAMPEPIQTAVALALTLGPAVLAVIPAVRLLATTFKLLGGASMFSGLTGALAGLPALLGVVRKAFISTVAGAVMMARTSALMTVTTGQAIAGLIGFIKSIGPAFKAATAAALLFSRQAIAAMVRLGAVILVTSGNLLAMVRNFGLMAAAARTVGIVTAAFTGLRAAIIAIPALIVGIPAALAGVTAAIAAAPAVLVAAIVAAVTAAVVALGVVIYKNWDEIVAFFSMSWSEIGAALYDTIAGAFDATVQYLTDRWDSFVSWLSGEDVDDVLGDVQLRPSLDLDAVRSQIDEVSRIPVSFGKEDESLIDALVPMAAIRKQFEQLETFVNEKLSRATDEELAGVGIKREDLEGAREMLALHMQMRDNPLFTQERGLKDQIEDARAWTGEDKARLELERQIRDAAEATGRSYEETRKRLAGVVRELQEARKLEAFKDMMGDLDEEIEAAKAVTAAAREELQVKKLINEFNKENLALTEAEAAAVRSKVAALNEAKKQAAYDEALRSAQQELELARATTASERERLQIKHQIADFEKSNGALSADQKAALESAFAAKNQAEAFNQLKSTLDPVGEATRQYEQNVQTLNAALASGAITAQQYQQMLNTLNATTQDARDPFGAQLRSIREAMDAARITGDYRDADVKTLQTINDLQRQGVVLTQQQKDQLAAMNRELQDIEKSQSSGLQGWINSVGSMTDNLLDLTKDVASGLSDAISGALTGAQGSWTNFLRGIANSMVKIGVNQFLKNLVQGVQGGAGNVTGGIKDFFSKIFGGSSPVAPAGTATDAAAAVQSAVQQMATATMNVTAATVLINGSPLGVPGMSPGSTGVLPGLGAANQNFAAPLGQVTRQALAPISEAVDDVSKQLRGSIDVVTSATKGLDLGSLRGGLDLTGASTNLGLRGSLPLDIGSVQKVTEQAIQPALKSAAGSFAKQISLTPKEILDLKKTLSTEWVTGAGEMQGKGIIDTILNRKASGKWGDSITDVVNARAQFSDINSILTDKKGRWTVDALPNSILNSKKGQMSSDLVDRWLAERAAGAQSSVGDNLNYANPHYSSKSNLGWINALEGPKYGAGKAIHYHGTTPELQRWRPGEFGLNLPGQPGVDMMSTSSIPQVTQLTEQWKQQMTQANVTLAQAMPQQFTPALQNVGQQFTQVFGQGGQALQGIAPQFQQIAQQAQGVVPALGGLGQQLTGLMGPLMQAPAATGQFSQALMQMIQQMASSGMGGMGGIFGMLGGLFHKGGDVDGGIPASGLRMMPANTWANAVKHHNGLKSAEYPAILKRGEKVLTANDNTRTMNVIEGLTSRLEAQQRQQARSDRTRFGNQNFNQNITVYAEDANSFRRSEGQVMADSSVQMRRLAGRNS
ncbi:MAG: phage tail tape measure protein [Aquamicrobium sp.]|uniref:phage tail tape measure protein n=1 Tax=Aquamicrobium sp. TaxID=1872579 RepID=UPI00349F0359|nr:phage tail tape measure protein [Aquamicrobium sp.]